MMSPWLTLLWHFGGLVALLIGAAVLAGWPGFLIAFGSWAVLATMFDYISVLLKAQIRRL